VFRTHSWNKEVAYQLHTDKKYAKRLVQKLIRDGENPDDVIRHVVRAYGIKELSEKVHVRPQNIARILKSPKNAKDETLNKIFKPFGLKVERQLVLV
jgi:hypothetical protein